MAQLEVNGRAFDAIDTKIFALGAPMEGVAKASYSFSRQHNNQYAIGSDEPVKYSMGKKEYQPGSMTLHMEEVVALENATGGDKDLTKLKPFKTTFTYLRDNGQLVTDEVTWKFASWGRDVDIDGTGEGREFAMHIISIKPNKS